MLTPEDSLRLNVLLKNVTAVRIDESRMIVYGLSSRGEARVSLNPDCAPGRYVRRVREFLGGAVLGSPGGYPVYLKRWTRMGEPSARSLSELLMLGEPQAVAAVAYAEHLTADIARRAWWADPEVENARRLLAQRCVREDPLGRELAGLLVEMLPFEQDTQVMIDTVALVLAPGLMDARTREELWRKGERRGAYRIGFLVAAPDALPRSLPPRADLATHRSALEALANEGGALAHTLLRVLDGPGQDFIAACYDQLRKPADQEAVVAVLNAMAAWLRPACLCPRSRDIETLVDTARAMRDGQLGDVLMRCEALRGELIALLILSRCDEQIVTPIFSQTDAVGSVMRRRLEPVLRVIFSQIAVLHD